LLGGRGKAVAIDAGLLIEGTQAKAAASAIVVGTAAGNIAGQADEGTAAVAVIGGGVVAMGTGYAGPLVAVFFCSRCCW
jgi:hypothetical protein